MRPIIIITEWVILNLFVFSEGQYINSCGCPDVQPPDLNCEHQKFVRNSCDFKEIVEQDYCAFTCDRCICEGDCICTDTPPDASFTCKQHVYFEKCDEPWMLHGNHCEFSCGRCACNSPQNSTTQSGAAATYQTVAPNAYPNQAGYIPGPNYQTQPAAATSQIPCDQQFINLLESNSDTAYLSPLFLNTQLMTLFQSTEEIPLTLFLPNQQSWNSLLLQLNNPNDLLTNPTLILQTLGGHVTAGQMNYNQLQANIQLQTLLENINLQVSFTNGIVSVGFVGVEKILVKQNMQSFCSSNVYVIDGVLLPKESQLYSLMAVTDHFLNIVVDEEGDEEMEIIYAPSMENTQILNQPNNNNNNNQKNSSCEQITALDVINTHPQLKVMSKLLTKIDIGNILERTDFNMTLFMPIDSAQITAGDAGNRNQASLLQLDPQVIRDIVLYHIVQLELLDLNDGFNETMQLISMSNNRLVTLKSEKPYYKVLGQSYSANIIDVNIVPACTVRVHLIDRVLMPYSPEQAQQLYPSSPSPTPQTLQYCDQSVWDIIMEQSGLSILQGLQSNINSVLLQSQAMTIFLPDARGQGEIAQLAAELGGVMESSANIAYDFLLYHIVSNTQIDLFNGSGVGIYDSLAELPIEVTYDGQKYYVSGAGSSSKVLSSGSTSSCNPVLVHNIEGALFPFPKENSGTKGLPTQQDLQLPINQTLPDATNNQCNSTNSILDYIREEPRLSYLVETAGDQLEQFLSPIDGIATYILPLNDAMYEVTQNQAIMQTFTNQNELVNVLLKYHAIPNKLLTTSTIAAQPIRQIIPHVTRFNTIQLSMKKQFGSIMLFSRVNFGRIVELSTFESCNAVVHLIDTALFPFPIPGSTAPSYPSPAPLPSPSPGYSVGQQVSVAAVTGSSVSRGDNVFNGNLQVVNSTVMSPTPSLGSDISQFFPSPSSTGQTAQTAQTQDACRRPIGDLFEQTGRLSQMGRYMRLAGYADYLDRTNANITIIAPIESAFDAQLAGYTNLTLRQLAEDESQRELFVRIISYHIIPYPVNVESMPAGARGSFNTLEFDDQGYPMQLVLRKMIVQFGVGEDIVVEGSLNNATVSGSPLNFCEAYVYPVDKVLSLSNQPEVSPEPVFVQAPAVYRPEVNADSLLPNVYVTPCIKPLQIIQNQNDLSTFIMLIYYAGINEIFNNLENITILAPSDQNLNQILSQIGDISTLGEQVVRNWLAYHIVTGEYYLQDLTNGMELNTLTVDSQGNSLNLEVVRGNSALQNSNYLQDKVYLKGNSNEAYITEPDLQACNAVVHIISVLLFPVAPTAGG